MAGGGGGAVGTDSYTKSMQSRVLFGYDQTSGHYYDWTGSDVATSGVPAAAWNVNKPYSLAPGAMRFVFERGITDKGGNPYEGVDTYNPDAALTVAATATTTHAIAVSDIDPLSTLAGSTHVNSTWEDMVEDATYRKGIVFQDLSSDAHVDASAGINNANMLANNAATQASMTGANALTYAVSAVIKAAVASAVTDYAKRALPNHRHSVNVFSGGMADINAVQSSAFVFGMAMLEEGYATGLRDFQTKMELELYTQANQQFAEFYKTTFLSYIDVYAKDKQVQAQFMLESTRDVLNICMQKIDGLKTSALLQQDFAKVKIVAKSEETEKNLEIDAKDSMWDMDLFQSLGNLVSAANGSAVPTPRGPSRAQSAIGGMASGAGTGAALTGGNPIGIGIGAAVGLVAGLSG